jgi:hypothetical protein
VNSEGESNQLTEEEFENVKAMVRGCHVFPLPRYNSSECGWVGIRGKGRGWHPETLYARLTIAPETEAEKAEEG